MIATLAIPLALAIPSLEGVLLLRIIEGRAPVLFELERWCAGLFLGLAGSAYLLFWAVLFGMPLTFGGFLSVHAVILAVLLMMALVWFPRFSFPSSPSLPLPSRGYLWQTLPRWTLLLGVWMMLWTTLKVGAGAYDLLSVPAYFDDTYANWNVRAKAFYVSESLLLDLPREHEMYFGGRVPSYPLTVYFTKAWLAMVHGGFVQPLFSLFQSQDLLTSAGDSAIAERGAGWSEGVVNSVHLVWFLGLLGLLFCALLRYTSFLWAVIGLYLFVSLPLVLVHGTNAYADVAMAAYLFFTFYSLACWSGESDPVRRRVWLRILSLSAALMLFVKSEALLLFLPPLSLLFLALWGKKERGAPGSWKDILLLYAGTVALIAVPWTAFKVVNALEFGNAQTLSGFTLTLNDGVPGAIFNDLFYTGSYLLLFPLFLLTLVLACRSLRHSSLFLPLLFFAIVFTGQFLIYYLTPLGPEAIRHTGFGRGMVQLLPVVVFFLIQSLAKLPFVRADYHEEIMTKGDNTNAAAALADA